MSDGKSETTDPEVIAAWPDPCPYCGREWERWHFMEWALFCDCPMAMEEAGAYDENGIIR